MARKLRIGFIGTGGIAQSHLPAWEMVPEVEVVALCDIKPQALKSTAERWKIKDKMCFDDHEKMLAAVELDIVDVCTPNCAHAVPAINALTAGHHVMVEKPVAVSAAQVRKMIAAGKKAKKLLMVAQVLRFGRDAQVCKRWIDQGVIGDIYWARAQMLRRRGVPDWGEFINAKESAGGPCYDIGVHILDLTLHLMGFPEPATVSAGTFLKIANRPSVMSHDPARYTVPEDFATALIRFKDGSIINLEASWALNIKEDGVGASIICGEKGGISAMPATLILEENGCLSTTTPEKTPFDNADMFYNECQAFATAIVEGKPSPVPGEQALITQRILDGVYKSGAEGREVEV
jgi:predicted dehydrogenase